MTMRAFDFVLAFVGIIVMAPIMVVIYVVLKVTSGSPIFKQERVGLNRQPFILYKFRTMRPETASIPTHLVDPTAVTRFGKDLRRFKLDELPQIFNVLIGNMSFVGPRPCLFNQNDLIDERGQRGVFEVRPGITGLAQIRAIDMSTPRLLAETDSQMIKTMSVGFYFKIIFMTLIGSGSGDRTRDHRRSAKISLL